MNAPTITVPLVCAAISLLCAALLGVAVSHGSFVGTLLALFLTAFWTALGLLEAARLLDAMDINEDRNHE